MMKLDGVALGQPIDAVKLLPSFLVDWPIGPYIR